MGCQSWPDDPIFTHCSICGEETSRVRNIEPDITREEAATVKLYDLFEQFYERRCIALGIPSEGPLPNDYVVQ